MAIYIASDTSKDLVVVHKCLFGRLKQRGLMVSTEDRSLGLCVLLALGSPGPCRYNLRDRARGDSDGSVLEASRRRLPPVALPTEAFGAVSGERLASFRCAVATTRGACAAPAPRAAASSALTGSFGANFRDFLPGENERSLSYTCVASS